MIGKCDGVAEATLFGTDSARPAFAVPLERSRVGVPPKDRILQPCNHLRHSLGMLPIQGRPRIIRCSDSAKLSHEPLSGVYSGITPWANSQVTIELLKCPARLSQIRSQAQWWQWQVWKMS